MADDNHGLPNGHANGHEIDEDGTANHDFSASALGLPSTVLIVTNIFEDTFTSDEVKTKFEALFQAYTTDVHFQYLKSFRRARVAFGNLDAAVSAHENLYNHNFCGQPIKCYYAQPPIETRDPENKYLEPPEPDKQYLISPPSSPPVGWEVINEREPAINYDLINAIARMGPGESYEVHAGNDSQPSIVVHVCEDPVNYEKRPKKITQTRRPDFNPDEKKPK